MHDVNICTKCNCIKPERAHHCSQCKRCVKRMDHHCLFVNNCVGIGNYKFFVLLLLYTGLGGIINGLCVYTFMHVQTSASEGQVILVMINGVAIAVIGTMLLLFASFHFWLAAKNSTTLEFLKGDTGKYDLGSSYRNFATVRLGPCDFHQHDMTPLEKDGNRSLVRIYYYVCHLSTQYRENLNSLSRVIRTKDIRCWLPIQWTWSLEVIRDR